MRIIYIICELHKIKKKGLSLREIIRKESVILKKIKKLINYYWQKNKRLL